METWNLSSHQWLFFDPIWPTDDSTRVQMKKNRWSEQLIVECLRVQSWDHYSLSYMNDIVKSINANKIRLYTDDTAVFTHNKNIHNLIKQAKTYFKKLQNWFFCNKLTLNCSKSYFSIFHTKNKHVPEGLNEIVVDDVTIKRSASVKYIGLHVDENLNWNVHIDSLIMTLVYIFWYI